MRFKSDRQRKAVMAKIWKQNLVTNQSQGFFRPQTSSRLHNRYVIIYTVSGDKGVSETMKGRFIFQTNNPNKMKKFVEELGGMNDDRINTSIKYKSFDWQEIEGEHNEIQKSCTAKGGYG